jgi:hypothetical protein
VFFTFATINYCIIKNIESTSPSKGVVDLKNPGILQRNNVSIHEFSDDELDDVRGERGRTERLRIDFHSFLQDSNDSSPLIKVNSWK